MNWLALILIAFLDFYEHSFRDDSAHGQAVTVTVTVTVTEYRWRGVHIRVRHDVNR